MSPRDRQLPVSYSPGVREDILDLPTDEHRSLAILAIRDLVRGVERGEELGEIDTELLGCRRLYFGTQAERRAGKSAPWRVVYRESLSSGRVGEPAIHVIAVGPRAHHEVYQTAVARITAQLTQANTRERAATAGRLRTSTTPTSPEPARQDVREPAQPQAPRSSLQRRRA